MIRVTEQLEGNRSVAHLEGRLTVDDLPTLDELGSRLGRSYVLDLSGLLSADAAGSKTLHELACSGLEMRGVSPYVRLLIDGSD